MRKPSEARETQLFTYAPAHDLPRRGEYPHPGGAAARSTPHDDGARPSHRHVGASRHGARAPYGGVGRSFVATGSTSIRRRWDCRSPLIFASGPTQGSFPESPSWRAAFPKWWSVTASRARTASSSRRTFPPSTSLIACSINSSSTAPPRPPSCSQRQSHCVCRHCQIWNDRAKSIRSLAADQARSRRS